MNSCCHGEGEALWQAANVDMAPLETIISSHFSTPCSRRTRMDDGTYARVFLFSLQNNFQVVGCIMLPIRESVKTEAEVAVMELVRGTGLQSFRYCYGSYCCWFFFFF
jgi:hypothetical protein